MGAVGAGEGDLRAVGGDVVAVEGQEFFLGEEDDGFFEDAEFGAVAGDVCLLAETPADSPVEEPAEVAVLFEDGFFFEIAFYSEKVDETVDAFFVEVGVGDVFVECFKVVPEGGPALEGGVGPLVGDAFFLDELVEVVEEAMYFC